MQKTSENIFQIWDRLGRKTPFLVKREYWPPTDFVVIEKIECEDLTTGKAFGYPIGDGKLSDHFEHDPDWKHKKIIPMASDLSWAVVIANYKDLIVSDSSTPTPGCSTHS